MIGIGADAGDHLGIARLHRAQGAPQRHDSAGAAERNVIEPAQAHAEMLSQPDGGIRCQREAADAQAIDVAFRQTRGLEQRCDRSRHEPVGIVSGIARIGHRHRCHQHHIVVIADGAAGARGRALFRLPEVEGLRGSRHGGSQRFDAGARELLRSGLRQVAAKGDMAGSLVVGQCLQTMRLQPQRGVQGGRDSGLEDHEGQHFFAAQLVRHGADRGRGDLRVGQQGALHLDGSDVLAAAAHDVLRAVDEEQRAVITGAHEIAAVKPSAGPRRVGRGIVLVVAAEESAARFGACPSDQQFAHRAGLCIGAVFVNDAQVQAGGRPAEAALARMPWLAIGGDPRTGSRLGHGPGFDQRHAEALLECRLMARVDAGAEGKAYLAAHVIRRRGWHIQQHGRHHPQVVKRSRTRAADGLPPRRRMEAIELDEASPHRQHGHERAGQRIHVGDGKRRREAIAHAVEAAIPAEARVEAADVHEVLAAQNAALRQTGGAGGVEQCRLLSTRRARTYGDGVLARMVRNHMQRGRTGKRGAQMRRVSCVGYRQCDIGVTGDVAQFRQTHAGVERDDARAKPGERQKMTKEFRPVVESQGHAVTRAISGRLHCCGNHGDPGGSFRVGQSDVRIGVVAAGIGGDVQEIAIRARRNGALEQSGQCVERLAHKIQALR